MFGCILGTSHHFLAVYNQKGMNYFIEQRISTTASNAVMRDSQTSWFEIDSVTFRQWSFNHRDGWLGDAWTAESDVEAENIQDAYVIFQSKLTKLVPKITLIAQCYMEFKRQPFMIKREDKDFAFFNYIHDSSHVGLMFLEEQYGGLITLADNQSIRAEFYKYWNDAVNTLGYSSKLLMMFSALEALVKKDNGNKDWDLLVHILGEELKSTIFKPRTGLRHRLTHGDYSSPSDTEDDYVELIHRKVIEYFNHDILGSDVIHTDVVSPQRHFFDNKMVGKFYIKPKTEDDKLALRKVYEDFEANDHRATKYDYIHDAATTADY